MTAHIGHANQNMGSVKNGAHKALTAPTKKHEWDKDKVITLIGRIASVFSVIMYVSYVTQIANNLAGHPGTPWQPLAAVFNCVLWAIYGWFKPQRDWPIVIANVPGIFLAAITVITSFV